MTDDIRIKVQFGRMLVNPLTGIAEYFNYPHGASEFEIFLIDQKANLRQMQIQHQWDSVRVERLLELYTEETPIKGIEIKSLCFIDKIKQWWKNK